MKIHEYQAKQLFKDYGINVPNSVLCEKKEDIDACIEQIGTPCVIKAQVHSGARGKSGGVKIADNYDSAIEAAHKILGMELIFKQAGIKFVNKILIEEEVNIKKEIYLCVTFDRNCEEIVLIISKEGGMDIEEVSQLYPEKIFRVPIKDFFNSNAVLNSLELGEEITEKLSEIIILLYKLVIEKDALQVEINPLAITVDDNLVALDAKIVFDDNALYKHNDIMLLKDEAEENPYELKAQKLGLNYVKLKGRIGCMVNGAGLAMTTMDIIKYAGKKAANFLDVGGGASSEKIEQAFKLLVSDKDVSAIFINIFGGILRCDYLAEGINNAARTLNIELPIIIRMEGTNKEQGISILNNSGLKFKIVQDLNEAIEVIRKI